MEENALSLQDFDGVIECPVCHKGKFPILLGTRYGGAVNRCQQCGSYIKINYSTMTAIRCSAIPHKIMSKLRRIG